MPHSITYSLSGSTTFTYIKDKRQHKGSASDHFNTPNGCILELRNRTPTFATIQGPVKTFESTGIDGRRGNGVDGNSERGLPQGGTFPRARSTAEENIASTTLVDISVRVQSE